MIKIAICDDDAHELSQISKTLEKYCFEYNEILKCKNFSNGLDLIETFNNENYDLIIIDIVMPGLNGIQVAREIRNIDKNVKIIFLTSSPEFAVDSYTVDAYYYLLKPCTYEHLCPILNKMIYELKKPSCSFIINVPNKILRLDYEKLEFIEVSYKRVLFHLCNNAIEDVAGALSNYEKDLLARPEFIKVHRSYIVNMNWIQKISSKEITTYSNKVVPISRLLYSQVKDTYMKYLFIKEGVEI